MQKNHVLSFTRKERNGIMSLVIILLLVIIIPRVVQSRNERILDPDLQKAVAQLSPTVDTTSENSSVDRHFSAWPAAKTEYQNRKSYNFHRSSQTRYSRGLTRKGYSYQPVDINTADTSAFIALPGIGSKLAARIVLFRDRLGGFVQVDQVSEVYGLRDSTYQLIRPFLRCNAGGVKRIEINSATKDQLRTHPYIRWQIAEAIVNYREAHGPFKSSGDLSAIHLLDSVGIAKLTPYFLFD